MGRDTTYQGQRDNKAKPPEARCRQDMNAPTLLGSGLIASWYLYDPKVDRLFG